MPRQWIGQVEVAFILGRVVDDPPPLPDEDWKNQVYGRVFSNPSQTGYDFRSYIRKASLDKADLIGNIYGPFDVVLKSDRYPMAIEAIKKAYDQGLINGIKYACVIFTGGNSHAWYGGRGRIVGTDIIGFCAVDMRSLLNTLGTVSMENIHAITEFGDLYYVRVHPESFDVMACNCGPHPSSFTKINLGWIESQNVSIVSLDTKDKTAGIEPISRELTQGAVHTLKIESPIPDRYFLVEARLRNDIYERATPSISSGIPNEGVVIYWAEDQTFAPGHLRQAVHLRQVLSHALERYADVQQRVEVKLEWFANERYFVNVKRESLSHKPTVTQKSVNGELEIFIIGEDKKLYHRWQTAPNSGWHPRWESLEGIWSYPSHPVLSRNADNRLELFIIGDNKQLYHRWKELNGNWFPRWESLGGSWLRIRNPIVSNNANGRLEVFIIGDNKQLYHRWQTAPNGNWFPRWESLGGSWSYPNEPTVARNANGELEVFIIGEDKNLYHRWQTAPNSGWNPRWESLGGSEQRLWWSYPSHPVASNNADGRLELFIIGDNKQLYHRWQTAPDPNSGWHPRWESLQGIWSYPSHPVLYRNTNGELEIFIIGDNKQLYHRRQTAPNSGWQPTWESLGGSWSYPSHPVLSRNANGELEISIIGEDKQLYYKSQNSGLGSLGGSWSYPNEPTVARNADDRLEIFIVGEDRQLYHRWQEINPDWHPRWESLQGIW